MGKNKWRVVWTDDAKDDLRGIVEYLLERESSTLSDKTARTIHAAAERLSYQALLWHERNTIYPGARFVVTDPYIVVYDVRDSVVNIARVLHGAEDIEAIFQTEDDPWI
jgi:toxin ParE1/3/4